ncbi:hypothetical protein HHI36_020191 [Cryptolaemus montrouzieri]|uniref:Proline-, glutamic acid-and leucine-rich protein 1 n=1 Tax=Cryptolaemus montrouzieri TaxID=559131 RepID=A0ABD2N9I7_9CUCU
MRRLSTTCHKLFDLIFQNQIEFERFDSSNIQPYNINQAPLHYNTYMKLHYQTQVLKNCLNWIMILMRKNCTKIIYQQEILSVVQRGLSLHVCFEQEVMSVESSYFSLYLIEIQKEILKLLEILIRIMGYLLAPFYHTVAKAILDLITRSQSCSCYQQDSVIREYIYNVLCVWLKMARNGFEQSLQDKIISCVITDAFPVSNGITLNIDSKLIGKSPKIRRKSIKDKIMTKITTSEQSSVYTKNSHLNICISALETLHILLSHTYLSPNESTLKKLSSSITKTLSSIQNGQTQFPFDDEKCQITLYKIIKSMFEQDTVKILPPIQTVLNVFRNGCKDENFDIAAICYDGLNILEKICQPVCSSMYTADNKRIINEDYSQTQNVEQNLTNGVTVVSEENRNYEEALNEKNEVVVLYNKVIVPPISEKSPTIEVIEIDDTLSKCSKSDEIITLDDNEQSYNNKVEDVIDLDFEDSGVQEDVQPNHIKLMRIENDKVEDEPVPKKRKPDEAEFDIISCLVDEVNDDYE